MTNIETHKKFKPQTVVFSLIHQNQNVLVLTLESVKDLNDNLKRMQIILRFYRGGTPLSEIFKIWDF